MKTNTLSVVSSVVSLDWEEEHTVVDLWARTPVIGKLPDDVVIPVTDDELEIMSALVDATPATLAMLGKL